MMWYEIKGLPDYRINHLGEVLSTKNEKPLIMRPHVVKGHRRVLLRVDTKYVNFRVEDLLKRAGLQVGKQPGAKPSEPAKCIHGHLLTPNNVRWRMRRGKRSLQCRRCHADQVARWRARKKQDRLTSQ